jgi:dUTP pyrophosphatase|uniref:dUTP diphosphatase n=1 Tax=viral metagenome TaxID=1070528 RepID=A0A6C0E1A1_9ZZZZ
MSLENVFYTLQNQFEHFAVLKLAVNPNCSELVGWYKTHVEKHNQAILSDPFPNSGFDLLVPANSTVESIKTTMISMDVTCDMVDRNQVSTGYYMFPRSSISKTPLMLSNHTGIIDAGYRGRLIGAFRNLSDEAYEVQENTRLLQVCHPSLCPVYVVLVEERELSMTQRGAGGFGSTGL